MITNKSLKHAQSKDNSKVKNSKPFSILSMGLLKLPGQSSSHRNRQIFGISESIKSSQQPKAKVVSSQNTHKNSKNINSRIQNQIKQTAAFYQNCQDLLVRNNSTLSLQIFSNKNHSAILQNQESVGKSDSLFFSDQIASKSSFLKLNNITNQYQQQTDKPQQKQFLSSFYYEDKQSTNKEIKVFVDMKKKIKKLSKKKKIQIKDGIHEYISVNRDGEVTQQNLNRHKQFLEKVYLDSDVIIDGCIFKNKLIPQRIDNDVDTDDQQINSGIRRLHKSLSDTVQQHKIWRLQTQKMMVDEQQDSSSIHFLPNIEFI